MGGREKVVSLRAERKGQWNGRFGSVDDLHADINTYSLRSVLDTRGPYLQLAERGPIRFLNDKNMAHLFGSYIGSIWLWTTKLTKPPASTPENVGPKWYAELQ